MRTSLFTGIAFLLSLLYLPPVHAQNTVSGIEGFATASPAAFESLLQQGQVIVVDNPKPGQPQFVTIAVLFNAPIKRVFSTITDYKEYPGRIPQTTQVRVVKRNGNVWDVSYKVDFKFSVITEHADYTLRQVLDPPTSITWTRIAGNLDRVEGSWKLLSVDNGGKTIGFYKVYSDLRSMGFLVRYMLEQQPAFGVAISTSSAMVYAKAMQKWVDGEK